MNKKRSAILIIALIGMALFLAGCPGKSNMMGATPAAPAPTHLIG